MTDMMQPEKTTVEKPVQEIEVQEMDAKLSKAVPSSSSNASEVPVSDNIKFKNELRSTNYAENIEADARVAKSSEKSESTSLTTSQQKTLESVNAQLEKDYGAIKREMKTLTPENVTFQPGTEFKQDTYGGYDPLTKKIEVNQDMPGHTETLLHEGLHMNSDNGKFFDAKGGIYQQSGIEQVDLDQQGHVLAIRHRALNEGITEHFTQKSASHMGMTNISSAYPYETPIAKELSNQVGEPTLQNAYFAGDTAGLEQAVDNKLGIGAFQEISMRLDAGDYAGAKNIVTFGMPK